MKFELTAICHHDWEYLLNIIGIAEKNISIKDISDIKLDETVLSAVKMKNIIVSGKAPVFIYMFVTLQLFNAGAKSISVKQAQGEPVKIFPLHYNPADDVEDIISVEKYDKFTRCNFICSNIAPLKGENLSFYLSNFPNASSDNNKIIISGKMPIWLASAAAIAASLKKWKCILCHVPRFGCEIAISPEISTERLSNRNEHHGIILGIVGDPNSGKSVFAKLLEHSGVFYHCPVWCYDCDYSAQTPHWYLEMLKSGKEQEAKTLRKSYKRKWIPGAEDELAAELKNISNEYSIVIADLPGGRHDTDPPQRIPCGRETLMLAVDYFIIIAREKNDCDTGDKWQEDLDKIGSADKIIWTIYSENPDAHLALDFRDGKWRISGLSRTAGDPPQEMLKKLWHLMMNHLNNKGFPEDFLTGNNNF